MNGGSPGPTQRSPWGFWLILALLLLGFVELVTYVGIRWVQSRARSAHVAGVFWEDVHFTPAEVEAAFEDRDDHLAWPTPEFLASHRYDAEGARPSPAFPEPGTACVAAFGDSFTYAQEVSHDDAWGNLLARELRCRVANFGVPGYGVDQAYLRYSEKQEEIAGASVVVIGFFPENIMRHVNQYVGFRVARPNLLFKPRFVLEDGSLRLVPLLRREDFDQRKLNEDPAGLLPHEFFLPNSRFGPIAISFPHTATLFRALLHPRVRAVLRGQPAWIELYRDGSEGLALTQALLADFVKDVESSGKEALVLVFTNADSVKTFAREGSWPYQALLDFLSERGIRTVHVGDRFAETLGAERICEVFTRPKPFGCTGHYTPEGYATVAELVSSRLRREGLLPRRN